MSTQNKLLAVALKELGQAEVKGEGANPRISEYLKVVDLGPSDEIPWCSAFIAWCAAEVGIERPTIAGLARSWLQVGAKVQDPVPGDIAVFARGGPNKITGHVAIFLARDADRIFVLGGNQRDAVTVSAMKAADLLDYRRLLEVYAPETP